MTTAAFAIAPPIVLFLLLWGLCYLPLAGVVRAAKARVRTGSEWLGKSRLGKRAVRRYGPLGPYAPIIMVIALGAIAAFVAGWLFVELAEQVGLRASVVNGADQTIRTWFDAERRPSMTALFTTATAAGGTVALATLVIAVAVILFRRKERASAVFLLVTAAVGELLNLALKLLFARTRPDLTSALTAARWYSFPSGHAMSSYVIFGALAYLALRQPWTWAAKSASLALAITLIILVGLSRVYLGVHWASDIAGGWSAGTVWLASSVLAFEMLLLQRQRGRHGRPTVPMAEVPDRPVHAPKAKR